MSPSPIRVLSLLPVIGHPRDSKRIAMLQEAGFQVEALAFERDYHSGRTPPCNVASLGRIEHGKYASRAVKMLRALPTIRRRIRLSDIVYASGPDMALAGLIAGVGLARPVVLEVGDIRSVQVSRALKGAFTRLLDRQVVNASALLVVTAAGFVTGYYRKRLGSTTPFLVIENKLDERAMVGLHVQSEIPSDVGIAQGRALRIGWFGVLRCEWSWRALESLARANPKTVRVVIAGYPMNPSDIEQRVADIPNMEYRGEYKSPQDLPSLYGSVDLVWACYPGPDATDPDWRWAQSVCRSNRFYESCFFQRPIITVHGSGDAAEIERLGLGPSLSDQSVEGVAKLVRSISDADLARWQSNLRAIPRGIYMYDAEIADLRLALSSLVGKPHH